MALPTSATTNYARTKTGVMLGVFPSTKPGFGVRLRRSTHGTTSSTNWFTRVLDASTASRNVVEELPLSTRTYYWQAQHFQVGYSDGAWSAKVSAKPTKLGTLLEVPGLQRTRGGALETPAGITVASTQTVTVGQPSQASPTTYRDKFLVIPAAEFVDSGLQGSPDFTIAYVRPPGTTTVQVVGSAVFPPGVVLTSCKARVYRESTGDTAQVQLWRLLSSGGTTQMLNLVSTSTGWHDLSGSLSHTVTTAFGYTFQAILTSIAAAADSRMQKVTVRYRMPDYAKTY